jgi:hypothetical protein
MSYCKIMDTNKNEQIISKGNTNSILVINNNDFTLAINNNNFDMLILLFDSGHTLSDKFFEDPLVIACKLDDITYKDDIIKLLLFHNCSIYNGTNYGDQYSINYFKNIYNIGWKPEIHKCFPIFYRKQIRQIFLMNYSKGSLFSNLPNELIFEIINHLVSDCLTININLYFNCLKPFDNQPIGYADFSRMHISSNILKMNKTSK